ncbi:MAG: S26 family signal peptidase [Planctomycetia bacterium]|nr:S26 family signal peptidase [Planctomycetia bacterium]
MEFNRSIKASSCEESDLSGKKQEEKTEEASGFASFRELAESLIFALLLAFFIKSFEAEAFVIPTGSMAPTLKGRHKDIECSECGFRYQVNASEEMDSSTNRKTATRIVSGTCPQCGFPEYYGPDAPSFTGDRILVSKCTFDNRPVYRWDVSVFRAPAEPKVNFIKRIIGLPNERVRIQYGDIFVQKKLPSGDYADFEIVRKPLTNLQQMLQTVYDNDFPHKELVQIGWPSRWIDDLALQRKEQAAWIPSEDRKSFSFSGEVQKIDESVFGSRLNLETNPLPGEFDAKNASVHWLRYRHIVPSSFDWLSLMDRKLPDSVLQSGKIANNPQLIIDQAAYNTAIRQTSDSRDVDSMSQYIRKLPGTSAYGYRYQCLKSADSFGMNWTGDLSVSCEVDFKNEPFTDHDQLLFDLVKGGQVFRCRIHPLDGRITLEIPGIDKWVPEVVVHPLGPGVHHFQFMNIDEQMRLLVDGKELEFPNEGRYDHLCKPFANGQAGVLPRNRDPNEKDLIPVSIGVQNRKMSIDHIKIQRDLYYIATGNHLEAIPYELAEQLHKPEHRRCDRLSSVVIPSADEENYTKFLSDPVSWKGYGNTWSAIFDLQEDQYLALGDNSGLSHDSRLWSSNTVPYYVDRKLLIGKAFYVYWPHGKLIPKTRLPFIPEFSKMRHID